MVAFYIYDLIQLFIFLNVTQSKLILYLSMLAFLTVGSTKFDSLVQTALSEGVLNSLIQRGYTELIIQCGNSDFEFAGHQEAFTIVRNGVNITLWKFKPSLGEEYRRADIIISHAGMQL